jgi:phage repressor protein C with HTH and peptisase S24 domain
MLDVHKLDTLIKEKGYTNIALSKILENYGIKKSEATIRKYRYGINDPDTKTLSILADILGVTEQDLFVGAKKRRAQIAKEEMKNFGDNLIDCQLLNENSILILDKILLQDNFEEGVVAVKIKGDSMSPYLNPGDFAICKLSKHKPQEDGKYLLQNNSGYFVKNVKFTTNDSILIISENEVYRQNFDFDEKVQLDQISNLKLVGKVIARFLNT